MPSLADIKRTARRRLHEGMSSEAYYLEDVFADTLSPVSMRVRLHRSFVALGAESVQKNLGNIQEDVTRIVFLAGSVAPVRDAVFMLSNGEGYRIDEVLPPDGVTVTAEVVQLTVEEAEGLPFPEAEESVSDSEYVPTQEYPLPVLDRARETASFRGVKRNSRRDLHSRLSRPAYYLEGTATPQVVRVRIHSRFDEIGSMPNARVLSDRHDGIVRVVFLTGTVAPIRGAVFSVASGEAYRVDNVMPPDDITTTAETVRLTTIESHGLSYPISEEEGEAPAQEATFWTKPFVLAEEDDAMPNAVVLRADYPLSVNAGRVSIDSGALGGSGLMTETVELEGDWDGVDGEGTDTFIDLLPYPSAGIVMVLQPGIGVAVSTDDEPAAQQIRVFGAARRSVQFGTVPSAEDRIYAFPYRRTA